MKKFMALLSVSIQSMLLGIRGRTGKRRRKARTALGAAALLALVALYISGVYSFALLEVLAPLHMESLLFMFMGLGTVFSGVMMTAFSVRSALFSGQDNDLLLSMPVSSVTLVLSRVAAVYLENLLFSFFLLVPAGVACAIVSSAGVGRSVGFWIRMLFAVVALPLLDTTLTLLVGALLAWLSSRVIKKAIGQNLVMGAFLLAVFWFSFNFSNLVEGLGRAAFNLRDTMRWAAPMFWLADGIMGSWIDLLKIILCGMVPFALVVLALGRLYRPMVTAFASQSAKSDYRLSAQHSAGQLRALLKKEAACFFGTPVWFWNGVFGLVLLVIAGVMLVIKRDSVAMITTMIGFVDRKWLVLVPMGIAGFCLSTVIVAAPSVSLEGKALWILRESPLSSRALIGVKMLFELSLTTLSVLAVTACLALSRLMTAGEIAVFLAFALVFALGHACFGMLMGLTFPKMDAANEAAVVKNSLMSFLTIFAPMALMALAVFVAWLLGRFGLADMAAAIPGCMLGGSALFAGVSAAILLAKGDGLLRRLSEQG